MAKGGVYGKIKGGKLLTKKLGNVQSSLGVAYASAVRDSTLAVHGRAIKLIQAKSPGTKTTRYNPKRTVTSSNPGSAPNTDRGGLVKSIKFEFENGGLTGKVGSNLKYAKALELGTKIMEARPWLSTALKLEKKKIKERFKKALKSGTKKGAR